MIKSPEFCNNNVIQLTESGANGLLDYHKTRSPVLDCKWEELSNLLRTLDPQSAGPDS